MLGHLVRAGRQGHFRTYSPRAGTRSATRAEWETRVQRWQDSGLTAEEFASELGINPRTLALVRDVSPGGNLPTLDDGPNGSERILAERFEQHGATPWRQAARTR